MESTVALATAHAFARYGINLEPFDIHASNDYAEVWTAFASDRGIPLSAPMFERFGRPGAETTAGNIYLRVPAVLGAPVFAHEFAHIVQFQAMSYEVWAAGFAMPADKPRSYGPLWLLEGCAERFAMEVTELQTGVSVEEQIAPVRVRTAHIAHSLENVDSLTHIRIDIPDNLGYPYATVACDYLLRSRGHGALMNFFGAMRAGFSWQAAFVRAFGVDVPTFSEEFQASRAN